MSLGNFMYNNENETQGLTTAVATLFCSTYFTNTT